MIINIVHLIRYETQKRSAYGSRVKPWGYQKVYAVVTQVWPEKKLKKAASRKPQAASLTLEMGYCRISYE